MKSDLIEVNSSIVESPKEISMQQALIEIVQRKDIDPDRLEKFLDLQIKMEDRQAEKEYYAAMANFQNECPIITKSKKVQFTSGSGKETKYDYAPLDEIVSIIKPILKNNGLSYSFNMFELEGTKQANLITTIQHISGYKKSFNYHFDPIHDDSRMNISQRRKSAITFAKREGLESALGLVTTGVDDDARRAVDEMATPQQIAKIKALMEATQTNEQMLLSHLKLLDFEAISKKDAKQAIHALEQKRGRNVQESKL